MHIYNDLIGKIQSGELSPGAKLPTEIELAKMYNVSRITVNHALKKLSENNIIYRVKKGGTFINGKRKAKSQLIVPIILQNSFNENMRIFESASRYALLNNCFLDLHISDNKIEKERKLLTRILEMPISGVIIYPVQSYQNIDLYSLLQIRKIPFVFLDREITGIRTSCVYPANKQSIYEMVRQLVELGHRRIAYFAITDDMASSELARFRGYCEGMTSCGIPIRSNYLLQLKGYQQRFTSNTHTFGQMSFESRCAQCVQQILEMEDPPTAIICTNDVNALTLMDMLQKKGKRIPEDISITGFDNLAATLTHKPLITTMEQNFEEMGKTAVQAILQLIESPTVFRNYTIPVKSLNRESVAALRDNAENKKFDDA